jgi:hypothetical protein
MKSWQKRARYGRLILILLVLLSWVGQGRAQLLGGLLGGGSSNSSDNNENSAPKRFIVQVPGGLNVVQSLCSLIGCDLLQGLGDPLSQLFVIRTSQTSLLFDLEELLGIVHVELDRLINILPVNSLITPATPAPAGLSDSSPVQFYGATVWNGYASQPAAGMVGASAARSEYNVTGAGIIGIIDTGVDPNHPALRRFLLPGYDFTRNQPGGSEVADLNQSTVALIDGGAPVMVNGTTIAVLDQSTVALIDNNASLAAFGHGTMNAGIVHLVAPTSRIMPLKAFRSDGTGYTSDIIRAVYYAVNSGVHALNMSFSMSGVSSELEDALDYAASKSVSSAAAAGNNGQNMTVYPAGFQGDVMGVGSTSMADTRSSFSNYGPSVWVAAPGEGIISTYPLGTYAAGWGTSFSTPFVTGTVGLLLDVQRNMNEGGVSSDIAHAKWMGQGLGHGLLNIVGALSAAQ